MLGLVGGRDAGLVAEASKAGSLGAVGVRGGVEDLGFAGGAGGGVGLGEGGSEVLGVGCVGVALAKGFAWGAVLLRCDCGGLCGS